MTFHQLPSLNARQVIKVLHRLGFVDGRQKGSHLVLINPTINSRTVVPIHGGKSIKKPLLKQIIQDTKLEIDEFLKYL